MGRARQRSQQSLWIVSTACCHETMAEPTCVLLQWLLLAADDLLEVVHDAGTVAADQYQVNDPDNAQILE
jgi:hypothetical protein